LEKGEKRVSGYQNIKMIDDEDDEDEDLQEF
jgi:hypothetical protein